MEILLLIWGVVKAALILIGALALLVLVHEAGHFAAAKLVGMRVDEFGFGFPPRIWGKKWGETEYTINTWPVGGFVRIQGENGLDEDAAEGTSTDNSRAFVSRPWLAQAFVLVAGVAMNMVLAWVLVTGALMAGTPLGITQSELAHAHNLTAAVDQVEPNSPAAIAGIKRGDMITHATYGNAVWSGGTAESLIAFVAKDTTSQPIHLSIQRAYKPITITATPKAGLIASAPARPVLGIEIQTTGIVPRTLTEAITEGTTLTWRVTQLTAASLASFFGHAFTFTANLSNVSGPIGIASTVTAAAGQGAGDFLSVLAIISINLAIINLLPIPALDGGRLLFVVLEAISRRRIPAHVANKVNAAGFAILILLIVVVSVHDVMRLIG